MGCVSKEKLLKLSKYNTIKEISGILGFPYSTVWYNCKKYNIKPICKSGNTYTLFDTYTLESCYWAGFIAADGNVYVNTSKGMYRTSIHLAHKDIDHIKKFKRTIVSKNKINISKTNGCCIQIGSKHVVKSLERNFNIVPKKSLILEPPVNIPDSLVSHYLRGVFDGDGHIKYNNSISCNFNIVSGSKKFIIWVVSQLQKFKKDINIYNKSNYFCIDLNNQISFNILNWIYNNSTWCTRLDRKYRYYLKALKNVKKIRKSYRNINRYPLPGCRGFNLDYKSISQEYLSGEKLKVLADKYKVSKWTLLARFKKLGVRKTTKRTVNSEAFSIFTQESCYWAGFITADGWVSNYQLGVELSIKDKSHLINLCSFLQSNAKISDRERISNGKTYKYSNVLFSSKDLVHKLNHIYGICSRKSLILKPPENLPNEFIKDYIRGYMDGDGSIGWHKSNNTPRICFTSGTKEMLEWIKRNIRNVSSGNPSILKFKKSNTYVLEFIGKQAYNIADWLYKDANIYLDRKYERYCLWFIPTQEVL
jgi:DNA-binding transcriptional regulator WhiA